MNSSGRLDTFNEAFLKNFVTFTLDIIITCINGAFLYTYFRSQVFKTDPRYILYIHLVINDMIMLTLSVTLHILSYTVPVGFLPCCILLIFTVTTNKNSPLNLAGMAVERYIAVCRPLHHVQICTVQRAHALIALIWGLSFVSAVTDLFIILATRPLHVFSQTTVCYLFFVFNTSYHDVYSKVIQVVFFSFVSLTLIITYLKVLCAAQAASGSNQASARNARNTILLHGVQLLICTISYISPILNSSLISTWPRDRTKIIVSTFVLTNMLPRLLSPLIYGARDKKFSSHIRLYFGCGGCISAGKRVNTMKGPQRLSKDLQH